MINPSEVSQLNFLGDAVIKSFLLMAIALTLLLVLRRGSAAVRHHIGLLSLVCLFVSDRVKPASNVRVKTSHF